MSRNNAEEEKVKEIRVRIEEVKRGREDERREEKEGKERETGYGRE